MMYWLQEDVGISIGIQVVKGIDMDAEKPFSRMTFRDKVSFCILCGRQKKETVEPSTAIERNFLSVSVDDMEETERWPNRKN